MEAGMRESADACEPHPRAGGIFDGQSGTIAAARGIVTAFLTTLSTHHGLTIATDIPDIARLVVSELVTNACKYAPGPCTVDVETDGVWLQLSVWDSAPTMPHAAKPEPGRIGQHGLEVVLALTDSLDIHPQAIGKRVTARLPLNH
ncbi:ATP-binding protein [Streptomyces fuscigenes]|uniref:ATP-binding protein n=1 Tax=Streptomyces fuscigenes TaxID=1528880 RepID=UPI001F48F768|nr:ATP-binding protein [Streptomyces fuscigenes]MCF3960196.1 ATP-binding protein [Streptomyces fuscigenes]